MKRLLEEWAPQKGILVAFPPENSDWANVMDEVLEQYNRILQSFMNYNIQVYILTDNLSRSKN